MLRVAVVGYRGGMNLHRLDCVHVGGQTSMLIPIVLIVPVVVCYMFCDLSQFCIRECRATYMRLGPMGEGPS